MADLEKLIGLERDLAAGGGEEYRRALSKDAVVIVPGATMGKEETIAAMEESEGWDEFSIESPSLLELGSGATAVSYRFSGRRGELDYSATLTSVYVEGTTGPELKLHQQTPLPPSE